MGKDYKIGETFKHNGETFIVELKGKCTCEGCAFFKSENAWKCSQFVANCTPHGREDCEHVIFVKVV